MNQWTLCGLVCAALFSGLAADGALVNVGDTQLFTLDASQNGYPGNDLTQLFSPWNTFVSIPFTPGTYSITFIDSVPDHVAWIYDIHGGHYTFPAMAIYSEDLSYPLFFADALGTGATPDEAFAHSPHTFTFSVSSDQMGQAGVGDNYLPDNLGGLAFNITKVPEPSTVALLSFGILTVLHRRRGQ